MSGTQILESGAPVVVPEPPLMLPSAKSVASRPYASKIGKIESGEDPTSRKHHLSRPDRDAILKEWNDGGTFVSPYSKGVYTYHLMALWNLGPNQIHSLPKVRDELKRMMEGVTGRNKMTDWARFARKSDAPHGQTPMGKIWVTMRQFCRWGGDNPYGWKLRQLGCVVDRFEDDQTVRWARLNTYAFRGWDKAGEAITIDYKYATDVPTEEVSSPTATNPDRKILVPVVLPVEIRPEWTLGPQQE